MVNGICERKKCPCVISLIVWLRSLFFFFFNYKICILQMILVSFLGGCQKQIITLNSKCILLYIQRTQRT